MTLINGPKRIRWKRLYQKRSIGYWDLPFFCIPLKGLYISPLQLLMYYTSTKKALSNHVEHKHLRTLSSFSHKSWWEKTMAFTYYTYNMSVAVVFHLHTYPRHVVLKRGERLIVSFIPSSWCWHHSSKLSAVVNCSLFSEKDQWTWNWLLGSTEMKFFHFLWGSLYLFSILFHFS